MVSSICAYCATGYGGVGIASPMGGQAFIEDLTLPLVKRSLIGASGDPLQGRSDIAGHDQIPIPS
jgi:hypothetical protein